jgi:hypothetical protein
MDRPLPQQLPKGIKRSERALVADIMTATQQLAQATADAEVYAEKVQRSAMQDHAQAVAKAEATHKHTVSQARATADDTLAQAKQRYDAAIKTITQAYEQSVAQVRNAYTTAWKPLPPAFTDTARDIDFATLPWDQSGWDFWSPIDEGASNTTRLGILTEKGPWDTLTLPALIPFLGDRSLLFKSDGAGHSQAVASAQSFLLHRFGQVHAAARADHQPGAVVSAGRGGVLS